MDDSAIATMLRNGSAALTSGDLDSVTATLSDDVVLTIPGKNPLAGDYEGIDGFTTFLTKLAEEIGAIPPIEVENVLVGGGQSALFYRMNVEVDGKGEDVRLAIFNNHSEDGRISRIWWLPDRQAVADRIMGRR